jgi:hypothetical protein
VRQVILRSIIPADRFFTGVILSENKATEGASEQAEWLTAQEKVISLDMQAGFCGTAKKTTIVMTHRIFGPIFL